MNENLKQVVIEYINKVNNACNALIIELDIKTKEDLFTYRNKNHLREIKINDYKYYIFHGVGCRFTNENGSIDWDFADNDEWCGINPWMLAEYISDYHSEMLEYKDWLKIKDEFEEAIENKEIRKKYDLYYFLL